MSTALDDRARTRSSMRTGLSMRSIDPGHLPSLRDARRADALSIWLPVPKNACSLRRDLEGSRSGKYVPYVRSGKPLKVRKGFREPGEPGSTSQP